MADQELREAVARAIYEVVYGGATGMDGWREWMSEADAAIAAYEAWQGEQRLKAHEMTFDPRWSVEMFGRDRGDEDEGAR